MDSIDGAMICGLRLAVTKLRRDGLQPSIPVNRKPQAADYRSINLMKQVVKYSGSSRISDKMRLKGRLWNLRVGDGVSLCSILAIEIINPGQNLLDTKA